MSAPQAIRRPRPPPGHHNNHTTSTPRISPLPRPPSPPSKLRSATNLTTSRPRPASASAAVLRAVRMYADRTAVVAGGGLGSPTSSRRKRPLPPSSPGPPPSSFYHEPEALVEMLSHTKRQLRDVQEETTLLKTHLHRLETEVTKKDKQIDMLLGSNYTTAFSPYVETIRFNHERSTVVQSLYQQIRVLRAEVAERDERIGRLLSSQKATTLMEVVLEKDEYYAEVKRLQVIVQKQGSWIEKERKKVRALKRRLRRHKAAATSGEGGPTTTAFDSPSDDEGEAMVIPDYFSVVRHQQVDQGEVREDGGDQPPQVSYRDYEGPILVQEEDLPPPRRAKALKKVKQVVPRPPVDEPRRPPRSRRSSKETDIQKHPKPTLPPTTTTVHPHIRRATKTRPATAPKELSTHPRHKAVSAPHTTPPAKPEPPAGKEPDEKDKGTPTQTHHDNHNAVAGRGAKRQSQSHAVVPEEQGQAVVVIQARCRGVLARGRVKAQAEAAKTIQSRFRGFYTRRRLNKEQCQQACDQQATRIQALYRGFRDRKSADEVRVKAHEQKKQEEERRKQHQQQAASRIGSLYRGHQARQQVKQKKEKETGSAIEIQARYRGYQQRKHLRQLQQEERLVQDAAATKVQALYRGHRDRGLYHSRAQSDPHSAPGTTSTTAKTAAQTIQAKYRGHRVRQKIEGQRQASIKIQSAFRGHSIRAQPPRRDVPTPTTTATSTTPSSHGQLLMPPTATFSTVTAGAAVQVLAAVSSDTDTSSNTSASISSTGRAPSPPKDVVMSPKEVREVVPVTSPQAPDESIPEPQDAQADVEGSGSKMGAPSEPVISPVTSSSPNDTSMAPSSPSSTLALGKDSTTTSSQTPAVAAERPSSRTSGGRASRTTLVEGSMMAITEQEVVEAPLESYLWEKPPRPSASSSSSRRRLPPTDIEGSDNDYDDGGGEGEEDDYDEDEYSRDFETDTSTHATTPGPGGIGGGAEEDEEEEE